MKLIQCAKYKYQNTVFIKLAGRWFFFYFYILLLYIVVIHIHYMDGFGLYSLGLVHIYLTQSNPCHNHLCILYIPISESEIEYK